MTTISGAVSWLPQTWAQQDAASSRAADIQDFLDTSAAFSNGLASISQMRMKALGDLAARAAISRVQAATEKKHAALAKELESASSRPPGPTGTIDLPNGSTLDLAKNTFTLRNGTVLDITTGRKVDKTV
jgi:hypothetical protein